MAKDPNTNTLNGCVAGFRNAGVKVITLAEIAHTDTTLQYIFCNLGSV